MTQAASTSSVIHREQSVRSAYPPHVTFNNLIRSNKRKSTLLIIGMSLLLIVVGAMIGAAIAGYGGASFEAIIPSLILGAVVAAVIAVSASLWSFYGGSETILRISGAKQIQKSDDPQLFNVVEELSIAAGIPMPRVFVIDDSAMNAFATGRDPQHAAVTVTTGLRQKLDRDELAGVMAHELSHIRHFDIRFAMLMATMVGLIVLACDAFWRIMRYQMWFGGRRGGRSSRGGDSGGGGGAAIVYAIILVAAIILALLAPMLAMMIRFAMSRQREYLADAGAVELTRYPQGLIGALEKLGACQEPLEAANRATAHLFIVNPLKSAHRGQGHELASAFRTHPPLHERIARLRALLQ